LNIYYFELADDFHGLDFGALVQDVMHRFDLEEAVTDVVGAAAHEIRTLTAVDDD
jgi:hypothetical protein